MKNKLLVAYIIGIMLSVLLTGCGKNVETDVTEKQEATVTEQEVTQEVYREPQTNVSNNTSKLELTETIMEVYGILSDDIEYVGIKGFYDEHPEYAFEHSYSGSYVTDSDLFVVRRWKLDSIGIDISAWDDGDFATVMINLNEYCIMYCGEERYPEGTLNKDNFGDIVSSGNMYSFKVYSGSTDYGTGALSEAIMCEIHLENPAYVTFEIPRKVDSSVEALGLLYNKEENVYLSASSVNGLMLKALYSDGYECNMLDDKYNIFDKKYAVEIKVNGEVIDYNGNSSQLFDTYSQDRNNLDEWQKEGRYYVHGDGSSCKRLAFYYNVAKIDEREHREGRNYVEWCGVTIFDKKSCPNCTNKIEVAGKEITGLNAESLFNELKEAGGYKMSVKCGDDRIQLYGPVADEDMYNELASYLLDYDEKYGTTLFEDVIVNRKIEYK